ncbi:MAG: arylesterase [Candidatus Rokubacteria bacterium]|nr:arylesterase [Candidatus Rokubacteria bacterium]MBI3825094.1 arylesterase [Candidatus Rokubacteria bacterium]
MRRLRAAIGLALLAALVTPAAGPSAAAAVDARVIVALGDSLTAGLGVAPDDAWPALLQARLDREGYAWRVVNAGVSGDTSAGGVRRVDWVLRAHPSIVIVALGANDGLRGASVPALEANLTAIVERLKAAGVRVLLAGMRMPANYGDEYTRRFAAVFPAVARKTGVPLIPFLLEGVAAVPALNQPDGIHPNPAGQRRLAEHVWRYLRPLLANGPAA